MTSREEHLLDRLREATRALRSTLDERDALARERTEPIAIIGIGCRLPGGASSPDAFWELLTAGRDAVVPLESRWAQLGVQPDEQLPRWAALLTEALDEFEPAFFGIAPREARAMDPQQRLLLEVAWEALEDAGIAPLSLKQSRTGVFVGDCTDDYSTLVERQPPQDKDAYSTTGNMLSILTGRLSYSLGLQGPCFTIDTACSSSLVAIHLACRSLRSRESELALAGGVNLILSLDSTTALSRIQALSTDGRCRTFDALANGYVRGEGCGVLVLKRLGDAERDGDRIWAVIRGSAINQDGRSTGLTAPNVLAQEALLREALRDAAVEPEAVSYVETHGTGTSLGDPIEVQALREVFGKLRPDGGRCVLGAGKTNIGHLEGAAGVAGVIKAALVLARERIPKNLHLRTLNAHIELEGSSLVLATEASAWPRGDKPRLAGVSGFGLSGTNVHVVLQEAPLRADAPPLPARPAELLVLSGRTPAALHAQAAKLRQHLQTHPEVSMVELVYSLAMTRSPLEHRLAIVGTTRAELLPQLDSAALGQEPAGAARGTASARGKLAFLFTGQGAQVAGMGRELYEYFPAFRDAFDGCAALFDATLPRPLREVIWAAADSAALLDQTGYTQPALFALEYALSELWRSWGVLPELVCGHSIGELVAACVAGVFTLKDAVRLCAARATLMQALPGGAMVSIAAAEPEVAAAVASYDRAVAIAAVNSAEQVVIAGEQAAVMQLAADFAARGVRAKALPVSHAFHSPQMDQMLAKFREVAETITYQRPRLPLVSNLTGALAADELCRADYWVQQVRRTVRFAAVP
jgi:polyketide synthase 12/epothilone polyketide synthase D